MKEKVASFWSK